jgi:hypothetical protein
MHSHPDLFYLQAPIGFIHLIKGAQMTPKIQQLRKMGLVLGMNFHQICKQEIWKNEVQIQVRHFIVYVIYLLV